MQLNNAVLRCVILAYLAVIYNWVFFFGSPWGMESGVDEESSASKAAG